MLHDKKKKGSNSLKKTASTSLRN